MFRKLTNKGNLGEVGDLSVLSVEADDEPGLVGVDVDAVHDGVLHQRLQNVLHGVDLHTVDLALQRRLRVVRVLLETHLGQIGVRILPGLN